MKLRLSLPVLIANATHYSAFTPVQGPRDRRPPGKRIPSSRSPRSFPPDQPASTGAGVFPRPPRRGIFRKDRRSKLFLNSQLGDTMESIQIAKMETSRRSFFASSAPLAQLVPEFNRARNALYLPR
jgi:hypothetical protein